MRALTAIILALTFGPALFLSGMNYERTGCAKIAEIFGCVPNIK